MSIKEACETGIKPLDEALRGGFFLGALVLLEGPTGSGKTLLGGKFLYHGSMKHREKSIYVSLSLTKRFFFNYFKSLDIDFEALEKAELFRFLEMPTLVSKDAVKDLIESMMREFTNFGPNRFVIDPINPMLSLFSQIEMRALIHNVLKKYLERYNITGIIIADTPKKRLDPVYREIEFLSDIILLMRSRITENKKKYIIRVLKYRGKRIKTYMIELDISDFYPEKSSP